MTNRTIFNFHTAGEFHFGRGAVRVLPEVIERCGAQRVFILTDQRLQDAGVVSPVVEALGSLPIHVFTGGEPEPSLAAVLQAVAAARAFGADCIIGLGGGSNMDAAKLAAVCLKYGDDLRSYVGEFRIPGPVMPLVCIPTTAGTGSEVSAAAVFTDTERQIKVSCLSQYIRPRAAVVDPLLTLKCPRKVTADSGIDALTHAVEAFTAIDNSRYPLPDNERSVYQGKNPMADLFAVETFRLVGQYLKRVVDNGADLEAREGMALAAVYGGLAFSNAGVALIHAMEYPVGGAVHCSHGEGNGLLLPYVMDYNRSVRAKQLGEMAMHLGESVSGLSEDAAAEKALEAVRRLQKEIGIPQRLRELGVKEEQLAGFAAKAASITRLMRVNPRYPNEGEILEIYRAAW
jgi:alcohol dehydrogenase